MRDTLLDGADSMRGQLQPSPQWLTARTGSRRTVATLPPRDKRCWRFHTRFLVVPQAGDEGLGIRDVRLNWATIHREGAE
jgi:hypothetical protein